MTITAQTSKTGPYNGNGATTVFSYTFKVQDEAHLVVTVLGIDGSTESIKVLNTDYTVTGVGNPAGGTIVMGAAPVTGEKLTITRNVPLDQEVDLQNRGSVNPETLEESLDKLTQISQDQQEQISRSLKVDLFEQADLDQLTLNVNALAAISPDISTVAGISADVTAVAADATDIGTVSANITSVNTVAGISSDVTAVAADEADIGIVATDLTGANTIGTVAGISGNVTTVAGISADVTAVAADATDIGTVSTNITNVNTVAGISGNVTTVAGISADVTAVAGIASDIPTVVANVTDITNFADVYLGPKATDPTLRNDGSALQTGDLYFNTSTDRMRVYGNGLWVDYEAAANAAKIAAEAAQTAAEAAQDAAETSETNADISETNAATSASNANVSRIQAEAARDAAFANADVYPDIAAGIAATTNGQQFQVVYGSQVFRYRNDSGQAIFVALYENTNVLRQELSDDGLLNYTGSGPVVPIATDENFRAVLAYDEARDQIIGASTFLTPGVDFFATEVKDQNLLRYIGSGDQVPIVVDTNRRIIFGYDKAEQRLFGDGFTLAQQPAVDGSFEPLPQPIISKALNHVMSYGQSLALGATSLPILSTAQPYSNVTFAGGPRAYASGAFSFSPLKPLVEDNNPAPDGGTNRGETPCSGMANYATTLRALDGADPASHVILASAPARGGYRIDQLEKGTSWYNTVFIPHIQQAQNISSDHAVHAIAWIQGENDGAAGTPYATYKSKFLQLQQDINTDAALITGQTSPVYMLTYQTCTNSRVQRQVQLAQLDAAKESNYIYFVTPIYHLPHATDNVHLTNIGSKWLGAYFGRSYAQLLEGRKPLSLMPLSATRRSNVISVKFKVPTAPLVIDRANLAPTTNDGFYVFDQNGAVGISSITASADTVEITLAATPVGDTQVRYAMDYIGSGLTISTAGSGNLRDSDATSISIDGTDRPLWHVAPHFQMTVISLGE